MRAAAPRVPARLTALTPEVLREGEILRAVRLERCDWTDGEAEELEIYGGVIAGCRMTGARLGRTRFADVRFEDCLLTGADLRESFFERCSFAGCKLSGALLYGSVFRDVRWENCALDEADLRQTVWKGCTMEGCRLRGADWGESRLEGWQGTDCDLTGVRFFKTPLTRVDFRTCTLEGLQLVGDELRGAIVSPVQAVGLARLLGLEVRD